MLLFQRCDNIKQIKNEKIVTLSKSVYLFRCIWKSCDGICKAPELPVNMNTFAQHNTSIVITIEILKCSYNGIQNVQLINYEIIFTEAWVPIYSHITGTRFVLNLTIIWDLQIYLPVFEQDIGTFSKCMHFHLLLKRVSHPFWFLMYQWGKSFHSPRFTSFTRKLVYVSVFRL